jgi:NADH-quinone oxidoreductase subunit J
MNLIFYIAALAAIVSTLMMVIRKNAVHSLLWLIVSLFSVSVVMFVIGAPFIAALEVIIYAGAIMVLFIFVIMMLNIAKQQQAKKLLWWKTWLAPSVVALILLSEMIYLLSAQPGQAMGREMVLPKEVGNLLFSKYILVVELAAFLLMAGIIGAYHLGQKEHKSYHRYLQNENESS